MANLDNKNRNLMIAGGLCVLIISCVLVLTFEDDGSESEKEVVNEFNSSLPAAVVEDVTDDKFEARDREQRRLDNEMDYSEGSSFDLLSYEEEETKEINAEEIVQDMQTISEENERMLREKQREYELQKKQYEDELRASKPKGGGKSRKPVLSGEELEAKLRGEVEEEMKKRYGMKEETQPQPEEKKVASDPAPEKKSGFTNPLARKSSKAHDIRAVVHGEHKNLTTNSKVKLRLLDPMTIDGVTIPASGHIYAKVSFSDGRIQLSVDNVNYENQILPFKGDIYDADGSRGLLVPDNAISDAGKETADGSLSSANTNIPSGKSRFGVAGISLIQNAVDGAKNAVGKQNRAIKVNISADYKVTIREKK